MWTSLPCGAWSTPGRYFHIRQPLVKRWESLRSAIGNRLGIHQGFPESMFAIAAASATRSFVRGSRSGQSLGQAGLALTLKQGLLPSQSSGLAD